MTKTPVTETGLEPGTTSMMPGALPTAPRVPVEEVLFGGIYPIARYASGLLLRFLRFANGLHCTKQVSTRFIFGLYH